MLHAPDFATMIVVGTAVNFVLNISFWFSYARRLTASELLYWSIGLMLNFLGAAILAMRDLLPAFITGEIGGMLFVSFMGFMLLGFQAFFGRPLNWLYVAAVPVFYAVTMFPFVGTEMGLAIGALEIFVSIALGSLLICREFMLRNRTEQLSTMPLAIVVYGSFAALQLVCLVAGILSPLMEANGVVQSSWIGWAMMVIVLHKAMCVLVILLLVSDRIEARLRELANTDMLTGVHNRRAFVSAVDAALANAPQSMMLAIFDLDHFKRINDTYGHLAGDAVLQSFCQTIGSVMTPSLKFGRMGGEEFAMFAPVIRKDKTLEFLDRIRTLVSETKVPFAGHEIDMQVSIGVTFSEVAGTNLDAMMAAADCALYMAKREGRNRICEFHPSFRLVNLLDEAGKRDHGQIKVA